jgi:hypothetical protein
MPLVLLKRLAVLKQEVSEIRFRSEWSKVESTAPQKSLDWVKELVLELLPA